MADRSARFDPELARAISAHQRGETSEAERLYRVLLKRNPSDGVAGSNLGILFAQTGRMDDAVVQFRKVVEAFPRQADKRLFLANAL